MYQSSGMLMSPPVMGSYGNYSARRDEASAREFSLRFVCPVGNIGGVIGKGGSIIKQIRLESGAAIKVDSSGADGDDCVIFISTKEVKACFILVYSQQLMSNRSLLMILS